LISYPQHAGDSRHTIPTNCATAPPNNPLHTDGLLAFYKGLIAHGISEADIVQMSQTNPAKLLGLKP